MSGSKNTDIDPLSNIINDVTNLCKREHIYIYTQDIFMTCINITLQSNIVHITINLHVLKCTKFQSFIFMYTKCKYINLYFNLFKIVFIANAFN